MLFVVPVVNPPAYESVTILDDTGSSLGSLTRSATAPTLSITSPVAGQLVDGTTLDVTWASADADGDDLLHRVEYSTDGGTTYTTIGLDLTGSTASFPREFLDGSNTARIRVTVSDGMKRHLSRIGGVHCGQPRPGRDDRRTGYRRGLQ